MSLKGGVAIVARGDGGIGMAISVGPCSRPDHDALQFLPVRWQRISLSAVARKTRRATAP